MILKMYKPLFLIVSIIFFVVSATAQIERIKPLEDEIAAKQNINTEDMPDLVKRAHLQNLIAKYKEYRNVLNALIRSKDTAANDKAVYQSKLSKTESYIDILEENLGSVQTVPKPSDVPVKDDGKGTAGNTPQKAGSPPNPVPSKNENGDSRREDIKTPPLAIQTKENKFENASEVVKNEADKLVKLILRNPAEEDSYMGIYEELFTFTAAQALLGENNTNFKELAPLKYLPETARTDKQIGASASSGASTSLIDKPGFASLLGFAVENGFVEQNVQDSVLTLTTSPIALFTLGKEDPAKAYQQNPFFNRVGVSASFNINSDNPLLNNATRSQLREYSVRFRLFGDRSSRSEDLQNIWDKDIAPQISKLLIAEGKVWTEVRANEQLSNLSDKTKEAFLDSIRAKLATDEFKTSPTQKQDLINFVLNFAKTQIYEPLKADSSQFSSETSKKLEVVIKELSSVQKKMLFKNVEEQLDEFFKKPTGTVAYINHRDPMGNYSQFKMMLDIRQPILKPLKLLFNAGLSFYHRPDAMLKQKRLRDFDFALSFEGEKRVAYTEEGDFSPITYSFTGRYQRLLENERKMNQKADLVSAQFLVNFPVFRGFSLPFSLTYSNATEMERKQGVRVNFGLKLDTDKLFTMNALKRLIN